MAGLDGVLEEIPDIDEGRRGGAGRQDRHQRGKSRGP